MSKITRRTYKRNKIALGLALFAGIGLISTGFAAFIISTNSSENTDAGVNIGVTKNQTIKITLSETTKSLRFDFEPSLKDSVNNTPYSYIRPDTDGKGNYKTENLTINIEGNLSNILNGGTNFDYLNVKMSTNEKINKVIEDGYIVAPECYGGDGVNYKLSDTPSIFTQDENESTKYSFKIPVAFKWGSIFGNVNPAEYYESNTDERATAQQTLDTMRYEMCTPADTNPNLTLEEYLALSDEPQATALKATALKEPSFEITLTAVVK